MEVKPNYFPWMEQFQSIFEVRIGKDHFKHVGRGREGGREEGREGGREGGREREVGRLVGRTVSRKQGREESSSVIIFSK